MWNTNRAGHSSQLKCMCLEACGLIFVIILIIVFLVDAVKKNIHIINIFSFCITYIHCRYFICIHASQIEIQIVEKNQQCDLLILNIHTGIWG